MDLEALTPPEAEEDLDTDARGTFEARHIPDRDFPWQDPGFGHPDRRYRHFVRFADDNRVRRFHLSREADNPDQGVVHVGQPIGDALLGNGLEDEVELIVGGQARRVVIEKITKAA